MLHKLTAVLLSLVLLLTGCAAAGKSPAQKQYQASFLTLFDTVTYISGLADSEEAFQAQAQEIHDRLLVYHQLFDIYHDYEGLNNLKTVNDQAGIAPVKVDGEIIRLLKDCRTYYDLTDHAVNVAMGSVLALWHDARTDGMDDPVNAALPDENALKEAALHTSWDNVVIDEENATVYLSDPKLRLDVGAVAKGWSVQRVAKTAPSGLLLSVGGNVCATGPKDADGTPWIVGITDPDGGDPYLHTLYVTNQAVVTSGDYQRYYVVDGKVYHHIIDPGTLYPAARWRSVTIVCRDSGLADILSTALFVLSREEGQALLEKTEAEAMWMDGQGNCYYSPGFRELIRT
ncbi:MAG: FAD:protein FMN transferase [Firmicutes bacterium]|nr:FAD:protein FMN transferase [Bacillota bacterium]